MKKMYALSLVAVVTGTHMSAQLDYTMVPSVSTYTPLSGGTSIPDLSAGSDMTITAAFPIGFGFVFDDTTYTEFQVCDNGYIHLGNELFPTGYGSAGGDVVIPNDFSDATAMNPGDNTTRPFIAPLWEELAIANIGGNASYLTSGTAPDRILTVEWDKISWRASTGTNQISFQVILHETTNVIDFVYMQGPIALGSLPTASIGLAGRTDGDYYSLSDSGPNPTASKTVNTTDIGVKPADGQMYTWIPAGSIGIKELAATEQLMKTYFNKMSGTLQVRLNIPADGVYTFCVTDMTGRVVSTSDRMINKGKNQVSVVLPDCAAGIYMLNCKGKDMMLTSKFVKE